MVPIRDLFTSTIAPNRRTRCRICRARGTGTVWKEDVFSEIELLGPKGIAMLSPLHVLVHLRDRQIKVEILAQYGPGEEDDEDGKSGVLKIGHLNFHWSELDSPTDRRPDRGWFEPDGLPICGLYVLKDGFINAGLGGNAQRLPTSK